MTESKVDEAWSNAKPNVPGYYLVRGFQLGRSRQASAAVEVRAKRGGALICNLHECNSDLDKHDEDNWYPLADLDSTLAWCRLVPAALAACTPAKSEGR